MNQIPKMVIHKMEDNMEFDDNMLKQGKTLKKNLIKYTPQKRMNNDDIVNNISSDVTIEDEFETSMDCGTGILFNYIFQVT